MKEQAPMIGIRHFEDVNAIRKFGTDAGLHEGQENLATETAQQLIRIAEENEASRIELFSSDHKRTSETATLVDEAIKELKPGFSEVKIDSRLRDLDQGEVILPSEYRDGELLEPLRDAWGHFWSETFEKGDMLYRFGESVSRDGSRKYSKLEGVFSVPGECYAQLAERYYDFIYSVLSQESTQASKSLMVVVGHSITFGIMHELSQIAKDYRYPYRRFIGFGNLPKLTWQYFDKLKSTVLARNPSFGEMAVFDVSDLKDTIFIEQIAIERDALRALMTQSNVQY